MASQLRVDKIVPVDGAPSGGGGGIIKVVQVVKTDTFTVTGTTYTDVTGMSKSISFTAGHKILIMFHGHVGMDQADQMSNIRLCDSNGAITGALADAASSRQRATTTARHHDTASLTTVNFCYLDSPSGTSETYKIQMCSANPSRESYLNRSGADEDQLYRTRTASTLTLMEISA